MNNKRIITLITDFGNRDHYVACMKGVMLSINKNIHIIDITHELNSFDIKQGAFNLLNFYDYYPKGTINVAVVDPGVGSKRKCLLVIADGYFFVGPDNGIFSFIIDNSKSVEIYSITNKEYFLSGVSTTFHGRDIFAPIASHLSLGINPSSFGRKISKYTKINFPKPLQKGKRIIGKIIYEDKFGNLITNIKEINPGKICKIDFGGITFPRLHTKYKDVNTGKALALIGSSGYIEISINKGRASNTFDKNSSIICYLK